MIRDGCAVFMAVCFICGCGLPVAFMIAFLGQITLRFLGFFDPLDAVTTLGIFSTT
jgi:hypothetical protein